MFQHFSVATVSPQVQALMERFGSNLERLVEVEVVSLISIISVRLWDGCDYVDKRSYSSLLQVMHDMRFEPTRHVRQAVEILDDATLADLKSLMVSLSQLYANL